MQILIVGSNSFIGSNIIKNNINNNISELDVTKVDLTNECFKEFDVVIHLAAIVHQTNTISDSIYYKVNRDLAYDTAKIAKECGVKQFIFMSTAKVFGESTTNKEPWDENSECNPQDAYGRSKLEAEKLILTLADVNFKVAIIRSPLVYGAGVKANMYKMIQLIDKIPILPFGNIKNKRSFVYVMNLVSLINHIIQKNSEGIFIAGDLKPLSVTDLAKLISRSLEKNRMFVSMPKLFLKLLNQFKPTVFERLYGSLELSNCSTNEKIGFIPPYTTNEGILEMTKWYKSIKK